MPLFDCMLPSPSEKNLLNGKKSKIVLFLLAHMLDGEVDVCLASK